MGSVRAHRASAARLLYSLTKLGDSVLGTGRRGCHPLWTRHCGDAEARRAMGSGPRSQKRGKRTRSRTYRVYACSGRGYLASDGRVRVGTWKLRVGVGSALRTSNSIMRGARARYTVHLPSDYARSLRLRICVQAAACIDTNALVASWFICEPTTATEVCARICTHPASESCMATQSFGHTHHTIGFAVTHASMVGGYIYSKTRLHPV